MLSFPHFYLADEKLREAVEGVSPPVPDKHRLYIDIQPVSKTCSYQYLLLIIAYLRSKLITYSTQIFPTRDKNLTLLVRSLCQILSRIR